MSDQRRYSVHEIDRLREAIEHEYLWGRGPITGTRSGRAYRDEEKSTAVEQMLRTYMLNGTDPEELERAVYGIGQPS